ncbi:oxidoreductase [Desulfosporosinus fructosivorans]
MSDYQYLFSPIKLGKVELRNRVVFLPHLTMYGTRAGLESEYSHNYYAERAKGGAGLIIHGCNCSHPMGHLINVEVSAYDEENIPLYRKTVDMVHEHGAKIFGQLTFGGAQVVQWHPLLLWAPSNIPDHITKVGMVPKAMEIEDIRSVQKGFVQSALNMLKAGFDGVELKMAHDGLIRQFLSGYYNKRTDEYGGSFENRTRFALETIEAVRAAIGPDIPLGIRLVLDEFLADGFGLDYFIDVAKVLAATGKIDYISPSNASYLSYNLCAPTMFHPQGFAVGMIAQMKAAVDIPVFAFGRINDPVMAEKILADGQADLIAMARPMLCEPEWVNKAKAGKEDEIRKCVACNQGCITRCFEGLPIRCIQNPAGGREGKLGIGTVTVPDKKKRVMVIGGGPAGLKVAEVAAKRGHKVTLYEKGTQLGGQVNLAMIPPSRNEFGEIVRHLSIVSQKYGVDVKLQTEVTADMVLAEKPDAVVIATGSTPTAAPFAFDNQTKVYSVAELLSQKPNLGSKVVIFDDDLHWQSAGAALYVLEQGCELEVITTGFFFGKDLDFVDLLNTYPVFGENKVKITPASGIVEVSGRKVTVAGGFTPHQTIIENVDTVIYATRNMPNEDLYFALKGKVAELHRIGDCVATRKVEHAIREGELLGREL